MTDLDNTQDSAAMSPASTGSVDILTRLADHHAVTMWDVDEAAAEIARLRLAIRRLAEQDATLSVCEGNVTVTVDATLTDAEREAVGRAVGFCECTTSPLPTSQQITSLRGLLERHAP